MYYMLLGLFLMMGCVGPAQEPLVVNTTNNTSIVNAIPHLPASPGYVNGSLAPLTVVFYDDMVLFHKADFDVVVDPECKSDPVSRLLSEGVDDIEMLIITQNDPTIIKCAQKITGTMYVEHIYTNGDVPMGTEMHSIKLNGVEFYVYNSKSISHETGHAADLVMLVKDRNFSVLLTSHTSPSVLNRINVKAHVLQVPCHGNVFCSFFVPEDRRVIGLYNNVKATYAVVQGRVSKALRALLLGYNMQLVATDGEPVKFYYTGKHIIMRKG